MSIRSRETVHTAGPAYVQRVEVSWGQPPTVEDRYEYGCMDCDGFYGHVRLADRERVCDDVDAHALVHA